MKFYLATHWKPSVLWCLWFLCDQGH